MSPGGSILLALVAGGVAVALAAQMFTNAVEWFGHRMRLDDRVLGSVFAAWGTALPETAVPVVAVLGGTSAAHDVGIGAILGAPFLLATMAFALLGATIALRARRGRSRVLAVSPRTASADLFWFVALFALAIGAGTAPVRPYRMALWPLLLVGYAVYLARTLRAGSGGGGGAGAQGQAPGRFAFWAARRPPSLAAVGVEAVVAVALLLAGAEAFVSAVTGLGHQLGLSHIVLAVVLAPLATEMPEVINSVVWTWRGRDDLALSAVTGAMIIQSTIGPSLGLILTHWQLGATETFAAGLALLAALFFAVALRLFKRLDPPPLLFGAAFYALFLLVIAVP